MKLNDGDRLSLRIRAAFQRFDADALTRLLHVVDASATLSSASLDELALRLAEQSWSRAAVARLDPTALAALRLISYTPHDVDTHELDLAARAIVPQGEGAVSPTQQLLRVGAAMMWPTPYPRRSGETHVRAFGPLRERWIALASARPPDEQPALADGEESFHVQRTEFRLGVTLAVLEQLRPRATRFGDIHRSDLRVAVDKLAGVAGSDAAALDLIRKAARLELVREEDGRLQLDREVLEDWDDPLERLMLDEVVNRRSSSSWRVAFEELYASESWVPRQRLLELALLALFEQPRAGQSARFATMAIDELAAMPGVVVREEGGVEYLRLSEAGRRVVSGQPSGVTGRAELLVQPNLDIMVQPGVPLQLLARLGAFCRLKTADTAAVFALDETTARRAAGEGATASDVLRLLEEYATRGVPATVARAITDWVRTRVSATVVTGVVILVDLPLSEVRDLVPGVHVQQVAPGVFRVPEDGRAEVVAELRKVGVACTSGARSARRTPAARHHGNPRVFTDIVEGARDELNRLLRIPGD